MSPTADVDETQVLQFTDGIPGFAGSRRFALVELATDSAFQLLQSLDEDDVSMVVVVPWLFFPDYAPELDTADQNDLGIESPEEAVVFCPVTLDEGGDTVYVNLLGPFVANARTRQARQVVLTDSTHPVRAAVSFAG